MRNVVTVMFFAIVSYFAFAGVALAQNAVVPDEGSLLDLARPVYEAILGGQWWLAAMFGLILATTATKKYLPGKAGRWVNGEYGQPLTVIMLAFGGAGATALLAAGPGATMSLGLAWAALKVAVAAAGGYALLKPLLVPAITKLSTVAPAWMKPLFDILLWTFSKPTAVEKAEAAGDKAVADKPAEGAGSVVGEPKEF